jgi:ankyrin repeat protein
MSLKAQVNCQNPSTLDTPLHIAVAMTRINVFGFLLLVSPLSPHLSLLMHALTLPAQNGADLYSKNRAGVAPLDLVSGHNQLEDIVTQIQKGHY